MKTEKIEKIITLTDSLSAKIVLSRLKQQDPKDGDEVIVRGELHLPTNQPGGYLHKEIQFNRRLEIADEKLSNDWGKFVDETKTRCGTYEFNSPTWKGAFAEASTFFEGEVQKLVDALEARKQALINAEEE